LRNYEKHKNLSYNLLDSIVRLHLTNFMEAVWGPLTPVSDSISSFQSVGTDNFCRTIALWQQIDTPTSDVTHVQSSFLSPGGAWTAPVDVASTSPTGNPTLGPIAFPAIAVDTSGYAVGVWSDFVNSVTFNQKGSTVQFGSSWSTPLLISGSNNVIDGTNGIVVNSNGYALSNFFSARDVNNNITAFTSTLPKGGVTWGPTLSVATAEHIAIAFNLAQNNNAFSVYQTSPIFGGNVPFYSSELTFGTGSWSSPLLITANSVFASVASGIDHAGNLTAVWVSIINGVSVLQSSTLPAGATSWTSPLNIATGINLSTFPSPSLQTVAPLIVVNPITGDAAVIFETVVNGVNTIKSSTLSFRGKAWTSPITVSSTLPTADPKFSSPKVGIDYCGNVFVAWPNLENNIYVVQASILLHLSNARTTPFTISNPDTNSVFPALSVSSDGYTVVTWINNDASIVEATVWTPPATKIFNVTPDCTDNKVTINGDSFCGITSVQFGGKEADFTIDSSNSITATVPAGTAGSTVSVVISGGCTGAIFGQYTYPPLPPRKFKGCIKKNKFLNKTECFLEASWSASHSPNVVFYRIYRDNKVIATISAHSDLEFKKKVSKCRARGYTITAVDQFCQESVHVKLKVKD